MPLYEYECESCGRRFERIQKYSNPPIAVCPTCGGPTKKLLSSPAIQFKGSGFYITDYPKSGAEGKGSRDKSATDTAAKPATSETSTSSDSSSKPAAKSDDSPKPATKPTDSGSGSTS